MSSKAKQSLDDGQFEACFLLPRKSPFLTHPRCHACRKYAEQYGVASKVPRDERQQITNACAFNGRRMLVNNAINFVSGEHETPIFPMSWTRRPTVKEAERTLYQIASVLLPILEAELDHIARGPIVWFHREIMHRVYCDACRTNLFAGATICMDCGIEWCSECRKNNPSCSDPQPSLRNVCRFKDAQEILDAISKMKKILGSCKSVTRLFRSNPVPKLAPQKHRDLVVRRNTTNMDTNEVSGKERTSWHTFCECLRLGTPMKITETTKMMQRRYNPEFFASALADKQITVVSVEDPEIEKVVEAREFFHAMAKGDLSVRLWKIKDFPPQNAFHEELEPMALDLERCWVYRDYIAATGALNLMARFITNPGVPKSDIGPKLYNSPGFSRASGKVSTPLHFDMTDAVNVNFWGDDSVPEKERVANWQIFPSDEKNVNKLRDYLLDYYKDDPRAQEGDIIVGGWVVITDEMLEDLAELDVKPWIIEQRPGDTIFIPARSPHLVRNDAWMIKAAADFLAGEALPRTALVQKELRLQRLVDPMLQDVLQLPLVLWYAWNSFQHEMPEIKAMEASEQKLKRQADEAEGRPTKKPRRSGHGSRSRLA